MRTLVCIHLSELCAVFTVHSSTTNAETKEEVAIKRIANAFDNRIDAKRTLREIKLLTHMDHENVGEAFDSFWIFCGWGFLLIF